MKILIDGRVLTHKFTTGVERYTKALLRAFDKIGIHYDIIFPPTEFRYLHHFWEHTYLPVVARKYDLLFCPGNIAPLWKPKHLKLIVTIHSLAFFYYPRAYNDYFRTYYAWVIPRILKISDKIITVSESEKKNIIKNFPQYNDKIVIIQNGVDEIFLNCKVTYEKGNYLLYVGSLNPLKNFHNMIKAFLTIADKVPHKLLIVESRQKIFKKTILKLSEKIEFLNISCDRDLLNLYRETSCLVFPSFYEASPLPPIEAMACGCPVLVSDIPALKERCGDAAIYCNPYDISDISKKMLMILNNQNLKHQLIEKGLERVKLFSWEKAAKETIKVFQETMAEKM